MRIREQQDSADEPMFNLTPMIDVVFQLLIFFMLATTYKQEERELGIELPSAASAREPEPLPEEIVINVFRDGRVSLAGRSVEREALESYLQRAGRADPTTPVTIRGDRLVHHEEIVRVMDACGTAGLSNLAVGTLDPSGG